MVFIYTWIDKKKSNFKLWMERLHVTKFLSCQNWYTDVYMIREIT